MSDKIKLAGAGLIILLILSGCTTYQIPVNYYPSPRQAGKNLAGSWMFVQTGADSAGSARHKFAGEFLGTRADSVFVLGTDTLHGIAIDQVRSAKLVIFKKQTGKIAGITALFLLTPVIGAMVLSQAGYMILGAYPLLVGIIQMIIEQAGAKSELNYPDKNKMEELIKFARFPGGIPVAVKLGELKLLEVPVK